MKTSHILRLNLLFVLVCFYQLVNAQVQNVTQLTNHVTIQAAITASNPGDVIELSAGSYSEVVTITQSLTLQGASGDKTLYVIDGTGLGINSGISISNGVTNVTIQNLTVQDFTGASGNANAGIYGVGGNDNLTVTNVALLNNITASGFYANGPITNVNITNSMVVGNGAGARGIVLWNGMKTNINITGNMVSNNVCCGIELQDGNASDVDVSNNTISIGTGDNAIGIVGLNLTVGPNTINNNTITGGGRYGIEIKNPAGGVTAIGNMITLVSQNGDLRDRAGIAIMRRGVQAGNADVPNGVTLTGNTIDGYQQTSVSEGFGIVVEGTNHTVTGNTVTNCEVGILQQQNPSGYPGDADQSNLSDLYFGRANSPITCGNTISGNTFLGNILDTRNIGVGFGLVTNTNTVEYFCSIQSAINDAQTLTGHNLLVGSGIYNEAITVDKSLTLQGASADKTLYVIDGTGLGTNSGIILNVGITNVTIQNLTVQDFTGASGNANAGIYGVGGNDNLTVTNVALLNNLTASGFYANGPITNVNITNSMVVGNGGGARGIVLWNGMKTNINITGNMVNNNVCCGIELQDGNASDVDISNNTLDIGMGDNAIGLTGLNPSVAPNTINNNTITGGGRYGIEIKNPAGNVTASGNMITLVSQNGDLRDRAGIAIMRRGVQAGNADVPNGVTLTGNTIDGYQQSSVSEGFGIVVEGTNHTVTGNTVTNCEVGILQQQNPSGYPGDADQSNLTDQYFGRANSPMTCGNTISGNTFSGNGTDTRNLGVGSGLVTNTNTVEYFCSIQSAIDDAQTLDGHTLEISPGTYNEQVLVTKGVTLKGVGMTRPEINFTGTPTGNLSSMDVKVEGANIERIHFNVDLSKLRSAIIASATGLDNITINDNVIDAYGTPAGSYGDRNAVSVNYGGPTNYRVATGGVNNVIFTNNTVNGTGPGSYFRSGLALDEGGGTMTGNTLTTINHDLLVRFAGNGPVTMTGNMFNGGGVELSDQNAAAGLFTLSGNTFTGVGAPSTAVLRIRNNYNSIAHSVTNNNFNGYEWGVSLENMNSITLDGNTFTTASATAKAVVVNTKSLSSNSSDIVQVPVGANFLNNNFNGTGTGLLFANHDSDNDSYGSFVLGTAGNENDFASSLSSFISLDAQTGSTNGSTFPVYPNTGMWPTTMDHWAFDMDAVNNNFDVGAGLQLPSAMSFAQLGTLEDKIYHTMDVAALGLVLLNNNNLYVSPAVTPTASDNDYTRIKNAVESAPNNFTINLNGTFDWTEANAAASWALGNDGVNATGDDYSILVPVNRNFITFTAPLGLGTATIQGPGDLAAVNLEAVLVFDGGDNQNWTISNMTFTDFDMSIGMFNGGGGSDAFNNTTITGNIFNMATDLNTTVAPVDVNQNIGLHYSFGINQNITNNTFNIAGDGISAGVNYSSSVAMQSNTSGGNVYNGLNISGNTLNVLNAQSANPQVILGIWENGHAHNSNITLSNNQFLNLSGGNDATLNLQRAFRVTSHSFAGSTVTYSGNTVQGANMGFQWIAGNDFSAQMPVQITGNTITGNNLGILAQSNGKALLTGNIFDGSTDNAIDLQIAAGSTVSSGGGNSWAGESYYVENLSANSLNLSGETFDQTNNFRRTDRKYDALDNPASGLVRFDGSNLYVSAPATGLADENITHAINASAIGDVVHIESGSYTSDIDANAKAIGFAPGSSPGCVTLGGNMVLNSDDVLAMEVNGTTVCTEYDQFIVNGTVTLGGANLSLTLGYTPVNGDIIILINNDLADAVSGQFAQGAKITVGGYYFNINYAGGDGNDVVLVACTNVTNTTTLEVFCGIQEAIDDAQTVNGHTLVIGPGSFVENITLNKELTLTGAGSGSNPATNTVFSASAPCGGIGISISAANVTVQNIYVTGYQEAVRLNGVNNPTINNMNLVDYCQYGVRISSTNSSIDITNTTIQRTSPLAGTVGIRVGTADAVNGLLISNSTITGNNLQGMVVFQSTTPVAFDNIIIQNSVISNNLQKGLYFEKLSNATLSGLVMNNNGTDPGYNNNNGIDINLKHNAYSNITIQDCDITNSAVMGTAVNAEAAAAITIKARDDAPSYSAIPASLNNVMVKNNRITGPQNGIRIGEYGKINASPTNVILEGNDLFHAFANKTVISRINADINLDCNWHGTTNIPTIEATFTEAGSGVILLNDLLGAGGDGSMAPGFQPTGNCACPSGFAIVNTTTMVAYCDIQAALDASLPGEEIHIMSGTGVGFFEVEFGKVLVILPGVSFTSSGEICNNGTITVNAGGLFMNAGIYSGKGDFNGAFNNITGGNVKPGGCGL